MHPNVTTITQEHHRQRCGEAYAEAEHLHAASCREGHREGRPDRLRCAGTDGLGPGEGRGLHADLSGSRTRTVTPWTPWRTRSRRNWPRSPRCRSRCCSTCTCRSITPPATGPSTRSAPACTRRRPAYIASAVEWSLMGATAGLMKRFDEMVIENKESKLQKRKKMQ